MPFYDHTLLLPQVEGVDVTSLQGTLLHTLKPPLTHHPTAFPWTMTIMTLDLKWVTPNPSTEMQTTLSPSTMLTNQRSLDTAAGLAKRTT